MQDTYNIGGANGNDDGLDSFDNTLLDDGQATQHVDDEVLESFDDALLGDDHVSCKAEAEQLPHSEGLAEAVDDVDKIGDLFKDFFGVDVNKRGRTLSKQVKGTLRDAFCNMKGYTPGSLIASSIKTVQRSRAIVIKELSDIQAAGLGRPWPGPTWAVHWCH